MKRIRFLVIFSFLLINPGCDNSTAEANSQSDHEFLSVGEYRGEYWPTSGWRECSPEVVGMNSEKLIAVYEYLANPQLTTEGAVIVKDGYIVAETYMNGFSLSDKHQSYSVAKSFNSALIGIAIDKGFIHSVEDYVLDYFSDWNIANMSEQKQRIKIKHLLTMTGGLRWNEDDYADRANNDVFRVYNYSNFVKYALDKPMLNEPGSQWYYSSGESIILAGIIGRSTGMNAFSFARQNLFNKLGVNDIQWESDPSGNTIGGWGINATVRDYAKFGWLFLNNGNWNGEQIISENWIEESTHTSLSNVTRYGYQWWLPSAFGGSQNYIIHEYFYVGVGLYTQRLYVVPEENLVVVRVGWDFDPGNNWNTLEFISLILESINDRGNND